MSIKAASLILRVTLVSILLMHSIPGMFNGGVHAFGKDYLDKVGFAPFGLFLAWTIKLLHLFISVCFLLNRFIFPAAVIAIVIFTAGIFMVHLPNGWFVVGSGANGIEFNLLLIASLIAVILLRQQKNKAFVV
ncbi:DoxX family protein [Lacibacter luteus]|uniref:DoxX family protein n=2 Tax=Lacibacter luteus TaxID=2508719 RepID=A0A4Q1CK00_9BACT|nr:DoxX family protein [Lacibacter luteus]